MARAKTLITIGTLILAFFIISVLGGGAQITSAAASSYSDPLVDLRAGGKINVNEFPTVVGNYNLSVIQIAESTDGELLIYVYQPAANKTIHASSINIARELNNNADLNFKNYGLEYLNSNGVFFKYRVKNFELRADAVRYYNISNILRPFSSDIDDPPTDGQSVTEVSNKVAQLWTAETVGDKVTYTVLTSEVIEITQKVVGYCVYDDGLDLGWGAMNGVTKAYFVAFDTDRPIDKLISVDISFWAQKAKFYVCGNQSQHDHDYLYDMHDVETVCYGIDTDYGENTEHNPPLTIDYTQKFSNEGGGNWAGRPANIYTWNRIRSTNEFISDNNNKDYVLTASGEQQLSDTKWVLNFYEAHDRYFYNNVWLSFIPGVTKIPGVADGEAQFEFAYDVMLLRLEFETNGERYNLGVVDNKQTGNEQFNEYIGSGCSGCSWLSVLPWWAWLLIVIFAPLIIFLLVKLIIKLVTTPFKAIGKRWRERRAERRRKKQGKASDKPQTGKKRKTPKKKGGKK